MERNITIDIAKGICIILVVIGHFLPDYSPLWYDTLHKVIYSFHMPLFMFASGYIYMKYRRPNQSYGEFISKKVKRLMIPYLTTSVIVITLKLLSGSMPFGYTIAWSDYVKILYLPEAGYFLWFIWALWWMFVIIGLCRTLYSRLMIGVMALLAYLIPFETTEIFAINQIKIMAIFFVAGVLCVDFAKYIEKIIKSKAVCLANLVLFFVLEILLYVVDVQEGRAVLFKIVPFVGIGMVMYCSSLISQLKRRDYSWLLTVSGCSYIIYLFHTTFMGFVKGFINKYVSAPESTLIFIIMALIVILIGILIPMALQLYVLNRNRILAFLFGLKIQKKA